MKKIFSTSLLMALTVITLFVSCNKTDRDETQPVITNMGITANPVNCQVYHPGDTIPFCYQFEDDVELGSFNIEIHSNSDHHSHSTESDDHGHEGGECAHEHDHEEHEHEHAAGQQPWVFNQDYEIPIGLRSYLARVNIPIPKDIAEGDYHFMIRLTDQAGWQQLKAVAIIIED
jgi:hypothetical protein